MAAIALSVGVADVAEAQRARSGTVVAQGFRLSSHDCFPAAVEENRVECRAEDFAFPQAWRPEGRMVMLVNRRNENRYLRRADVRNSTTPGVPSAIILNQLRDAAAIRASTEVQRRAAAMTEIAMLEERQRSAESTVDARVTEARLRLARDAYAATAQAPVNQAAMQLELERLRLAADIYRQQLQQLQLTQRAEQIAAQLTPAGVRVERTANQEILLTLADDATFEPGRSEVSQPAQTSLTAIRSFFALPEQANTYLVVIGHADRQDERGASQQLSEQRATAVATALIGGDLTSERVFAVGVGATQNVTGEDAPQNRSRNRRIEIIVTPR